MKISIWLIAEQLRSFSPKCDIKNGPACIEGIRFLEDAKASGAEDRYVYLVTEHATNSVLLLNGQDILLIENQDLEAVLNRLLETFEFYNRWESALWSSTSQGTLQAVLDRADEALGNPMILSSLEGNVLAMTGRYRDQDLNENWVYCRDSGRLPTAILGTPVYTPDRREASWSATPQILLLENRVKTIGVMLYLEERPVAALSLWEYETPVTQGHVQLMKVLCDVLSSLFGADNSSSELRDSASILSDLLSGIRIDGNLLHRVDLRCPRPWTLLTIRNAYRVNPVSLQSLVRQMVMTGIPCVPLIFEERAVCLTHAGRSSELLSRVLGEPELSYYTSVESMPFSELSQLLRRYRQNLFCEECHARKPGAYRASDSGMAYALSLLASAEDPELLIHPALGVLRQYDAENGGDFYHSLFYYLYYERSIQQAAEAVHVHRNSFLYRIKRIQSLYPLDLDDPAERAYLLLTSALVQAARREKEDNRGKHQL